MWVGWVKHSWRISGKATVVQTVLCTVTTGIANGNIVVEVFVFSEAAWSPVPTNLCDKKTKKQQKKQPSIHPLAGNILYQAGHGYVVNNRSRFLVTGHEKISLN